MLELAKCRECGKVKLCIANRGFRHGEPIVSYYCPECDEAIDEWLDGEVERWSDFMLAGFGKAKRG